MFSQANFILKISRERSDEYEAWLLALQHLWCNKPYFGFETINRTHQSLSENLIYPTFSYIDISF